MLAWLMRRLHTWEPSQEGSFAYDEVFRQLIKVTLQEYRYFGEEPSQEKT